MIFGTLLQMHYVTMCHVAGQSGDDGVDVGAVAGGVVGGLALIAVVVGGVIWYKFIRQVSKVIPV